MKDKQLENKLMKLKPKLMLFDTSLYSKQESLMQNNLLVKIYDPIFMEEIMMKKHHIDFTNCYENNFIPVYSNNV